VTPHGREPGVHQEHFMQESTGDGRVQLQHRGAAVTLAMASLAAFASPATAQVEDGQREEQVWEFGLGAGAMYRPDYEGSDDYEVRGAPIISVSYRDFIKLRGPALTIDAFQLSGSELARNLSFGAMLKYDMGREANDNPALRRLPEIDGGLDAGVFVAYDLGSVSLGLSVLQDMGDRHEGTLAEVELGYMRALSAQLLGQVEVSATWADDNYTQAYFGVTRAEAQASGLREFAASGGMKDVGAAVSLHYLLSEHWRVTGRLAYRTLLGDAADGPLVKDEGSKNQSSAALFVTYQF
jgi:outer membrane scaffolding protein for murein synthesis (MipA/OmpV family)